MPIYEYACPSCGSTFEELVFGDAHPPCPECGSSRADRLMSRACFHTGGDSGGYDDAPYAPSGGSCGCGGCSGGNCASCG